MAVINSKGEYQISKNGERDGENIWNVKDANGNFVIQDIIKKSKEANGGIVYYKYPWKNSEKEKARNKIAALVYYEPWDWVINAGSWEDEFYNTNHVFNAGMNQLIKVILLIALLVGVAGVLFSKRLGKKISKPIKKMAEISSELALGKLDSEIDYV